MSVTPYPIRFVIEAFFIGKDEPGDLRPVQSPVRKDNIPPEEGDRLIIAKTADLKHPPAHVVEHQDTRFPLFLQILKNTALPSPDASRNPDDKTLFQ